MGRTRGRGGRAPHHGPDRGRDERRAERDGRPLDLALRALGRAPDLRGRDRQLLRAPAGVRAPARRRPAGRSHAERRAAVLALGPHLPLRPGQPGSLAHGAQDARRLGDRAAVQVGAGSRGRFRPRRPHDAVPGAARSGEGRRRRPLRASDRRVAGRQQQQRGGRLLLPGRPVLLRARPGPPHDARGHRQRRRLRAQRDARARQGRRPGRDRGGPAPRTVRVQRARRGRRGRDPDAPRRAGPGRPEPDREEDEGAERLDPAEGREDPPLLRPARPHRAHDPHRRGQPPARDGPRDRRARVLPLRLPLRPHRGRHDPALSSLRLRLSRPEARAREPAVDRSDRLRHPRRRRRRHGGERVPADGSQRGRGKSPGRDGGDRAGGRGGGPADLLRRGRHHRGVPSHLRALGPVRRALSADGRHHDLRADRRARHGAHAGAGALLLGDAARREGAAERRLREDPHALRTRSRCVPRASVAHDRRELRAPRALAPPDSGDRRRVHAAPGRGRPLGPRHDAVHDLVRGGREDLATGPLDPQVLSRGHGRRERARPAGRRHGPDRLLQRRVLRRAEAVPRVERESSATRRP